MSDEDKKAIKRILIAMDASSHSMAALEAAADLARYLGASIHGLFVEDINWYHTSKLSFTTELDELTGTLRKFDEEDMQRKVKAMCRRMERALFMHAGQNELEHTFDVVRGEVEKELLAAAQKNDLITIGRIGHSDWSGTRMGKTAEYIISKTDKPILLLQRGLRVGRSIVGLYDATEAGKRVLQLVKTMADTTGKNVNILIFNRQDDELKEDRKMISELFKGTRYMVRAHSLPLPDLLNVSRYVNSHKGGLVIGSRSQDLFNKRNIERLLADVDCPLMLL